MSYTIPFKQGAKILEVGGGENPLFKPNMDCRELPQVDIVADLEKRWPIPDNTYDGVFGKFIIEHITWRRTEHFIKETFRILKQGGTAVFIGPNTFEQCKEIIKRGRIGIAENALLYGGQEFTDNFHKAAFSFQYIQEVFRKVGFSEVKTVPLPTCHTDLIIEAHKGGGAETSFMDSEWYNDLKMDLEGFPKEDYQLNIGSFTVMLPPPFINIDVIDLTKYAKENNFIFQQLDVRYGLPYDDDSAQFINCMHIIEHLSRKDGEVFIRECYRVLKPKATLRVGVPDAQAIASSYVNNEMGKYVEHQPDEYKGYSESHKFWSLLTSGHRTCYDYESLGTLLKNVGFHIRQSKYDAVFDTFPDHSLYVEAIKPKVEIMRSKRKKKKLKVGLISTPMLKTPPDFYGGLELIVANLGEILARLGHEVTIFAADGSKVPGCDIVELGPPMGKVQVDWAEAERKFYEQYQPKLSEFDVIHGHNWFGYEYLAKVDNPALKVCHTHHGGLAWSSKPPGIEHLNLISISKWMQKVYNSKGFPSEYVYNGVNLEAYPFKKKKGQRLLFIGRIDTFKQPHVAIEVAERMNMSLDIVGGTFVQDKNFLEHIRNKVKSNSRIEIYEDATHEKKVELLRNARAVIFPSKMGEPFGLVPVEAMACGTPTVALVDGATPEVVKKGTGYLCQSVEGLIKAVRMVKNVKPKYCRKVAEKYFSREVMTENYLDKYFKILEGEEW